MPPGQGIRTSLSFKTDNVSWPNNFDPQNGVFSPGTPMIPAVQQAIRALDFNVGQNTLITPRSPELISFRELRAYSNVELVRLAIETRKDQLERLEWQINPKNPVAKKRGKGRDDARIKALTKFWAKPDGTTHFTTWVRLIMEDLLVIDAPTIERRRDRGGRLIGLDVVQGDTFKLLVDPTGRRPVYPEPAYEQIIKGTVWNALTTKDLIYAPRNPRPGKLYGLSPTEQVIVTINTIMRRQAAQLGYFTEGNVPAGILNAPDGWGPDAVKTMQDAWDSRNEGDPTKNSKLKWVPAGTKYQAFKESPLKDDFDEWLARVVAYAFSLPPTPFIKQMNRSTGQTDQDRGLEEGLEPIKLWLKRLIDAEIEEEFGCDDLEFDWVDTPSIDPAIQSTIDDLNLRNGSVTINEVRDARGQDPLGDGLGDDAMLYTSTGAVTLDQVIKASEDAMAPPEPIQPVHMVDGSQPQQPADSQDAPKATDKPAPAKTPPEAHAEKFAKASDPTSIDRPLARRSIAAIRKGLIPILKETGDDAAADVAKALKTMGKAADDAEAAQKAEDAAKKIADAVDLAALDEIAQMIYEPIFEVVQDSTEGALASVGVDLSSAGIGDGITGQVYQAAVDYAKDRAAEMVSVDGDMNVVESTRAVIQKVIADGLQQNIGSKAIADNIQAATAFSKERAQTIALNEIRMANATGKFNGWKKAASYGVTFEKRWQTSNVYKCCDLCEANELDGYIPLDQPFSSGAMSEADSHVNCRCVTTVRTVKPKA